MANVVITGSTKGVGRGLADAFARLGHNVVITSRRQADIATCLLYTSDAADE